MKPFLFHIGQLGVPSFFFMIMIGALAATFFASWMARREDADPVAMLDFGIIAIIASVIGARIFHILVENPVYYWEKPIRVFYFWQGGFVSIGAYLASAVGWFIYLKLRRLDRWRHIDLVTTAVPIIIFFVRLGCLLVGCCYGKPTDFFIHLVFTDPASTAGHYHLGVPLHATQPYFMFNALVMFGVLQLIYRRRTFYGQAAAAFLIYYGVTRFLIEFLRGDADRGLYFNDAISTGQLAMAAALVVGIILWIALRKRYPIDDDKHT